MSSEQKLRVILLIVGLFIVAGIVLHDYYSRRQRTGATRGRRREPRLSDLELPVVDDDEAETAPASDWGKFDELDDPPPLAHQAPSPAARPPPPPLHLRDAQAEPAPAAAAKAGHSAQKQAENRVKAAALRAKMAPAQPAATPAKATAASNASLGPQPDKIVTLYVRARPGRTISGVELLDAAIKTGLHFGNRKIFHRVDEGGKDPLFSMANLVKPGNFDSGSWNVFATPGVALFMTLPGPQSALDTWDAMYAAGLRLSELLNAELLDDGRCRMSRQRIAQMREEMRDYDRRQEVQHGLDHGPGLR